MLPQHSQKAFWLDKFSANMKKYLYCTISWHPRTAFLKHIESNVCIILFISPEKNLCSWDIVRFYLVRGGMGEVEWFLSGGLLIGSCKMFYNCSYYLIFLKIQLFFRILILLSIALKLWNFPDNLDFKGKIVTKFLIRSHFLSI